MTLFKSTILSLLATAIKMLSGFVINKAVAVYIGPAGLALVGQLQNIIQLVMTFASGAIKSGVIKYTAQYGRNSEKIPVLFGTASKISIVCSVVVGLCVIALSNYASVWFLKSNDYAYVFVIFGFTVVLFVLNNLLLSILNGLKEIKTFISINIIQSVYSLIFTTSLIILLGLHGALIALVTNQSLIFFVVIWMLRKHDIIKLSNFLGDFDICEAKRLGGFALMTVTSAAMAPVSQIIVRKHLVESLGWEQAGYWQSINYISNMYLMVATTVLGIYYLPKLSELTDKAALRKELVHGYIVIVPIVIASSLAIFLLKDVIILLLFTKDFEPMAELFLWQLIGGVLKMASWLLSYLLLAKAMVTSFIWTEIVFTLTFIALVFYLVSNYGIVGVTYAFAANYLLYGMVIFFVVKKKLF